MCQYVLKGYLPYFSCAQFWCLNTFRQWMHLAQVIAFSCSSNSATVYILPAKFVKAELAVFTKRGMAQKLIACGSRDTLWQTLKHLISYT